MVNLNFDNIIDEYFDLKEVRKGLGLSQKELGEFLEVDSRTIRRWENGEIQMKKVYILAVILLMGSYMVDCDLDYFNESVRSTSSILSEQVDKDETRDIFRNVFYDSTKEE